MELFSVLAAFLVSLAAMLFLARSLWAHSYQAALFPS